MVETCDRNPKAVTWGALRREQHQYLVVAATFVELQELISSKAIETLEHSSLHEP
jgi:hypothetical protein